MTETKGYAIVIDAGSSGSRALVYEYTSDITNNPSGLPKITQISNFKTKPGLSSFGLKLKGSYDLWNSHFKSLIEEAKRIIPTNLQSSTPIYVQATAGMRLLPTNDRNRILQETCQVLSENSEFIVEPCNDHVQVIDGDTEGLYGWLALNYLTDKLSYNDQHPYGFMDMGGASTQLAFVPSRLDQLEKHEEDMYSVNLRTNDGQLNSWSVFVSSWLGFGANEARRRQLDALVNALPDNVNYDKDGDGKGDLVDPCSPIGMETEVEYNGKKFTVTGSGEYEGCLKTIYPLLLKHLPCSDEPCLFNGVHAPSIDFTLEKFVGVSEYWYTANDVFKLGGEYNYEQFEIATKEFCATNWEIILEKFQNKEYGNALTLDLLKTSCFKASWIVNILHEGFGMPRLGIDSGSKTHEEEEPIFKSVNNIDGNELSWTLGKMVVYASSQNIGDGVVGIFPGSAIEKTLVDNKDSTFIVGTKEDISGSAIPLLPLSTCLLVFCFVYYFILKKFGNFKKFMKIFRGNQKTESMVELVDLEEGRSISHQASTDNIDGKLRTRSTMSLQDLGHMSPHHNLDKSQGASHETLKHSFTFASFRDPNLHTGKKITQSTFKLGNGSQLSLKSMVS